MLRLPKICLNFFLKVMAFFAIVFCGGAWVKGIHRPIFGASMLHLSELIGVEGLRECCCEGMARFLELILI
ncbi:hypothetical protein [Paracoccus sp. SCSIO 75233]|uniref:hypothetical protein n=1 Tax=Paracoccus sp. SCSIO 75233 TaxID=3017782 RepID=UPI0022F0CFBC|nr:hypothetical protein [Paracoccus sp. SCSIO 75233]WBU52367.1 hypothetical protein PAF12_11050 [Paracoccus sp. SCSIO 75233]